MSRVDLGLRLRTVALALSLITALNLLFVLLSVLPRNDALGMGYALLRSYGNLAVENTAGSWYSSMLFAAASAAMFLCFRVEQRLSKASAELHSSIVGRYGWLGICMVFALLSFDEMGSLHERLARLPLLRHLPVIGDSAYSWATKLAIPILMVAIAILWFVWSYLRSAPAAIVAALLGVGMLLTVPIQEHIEDSLTSQNIVRSKLALALEEGTELFGALCFLAAPLLFLRSRLLETARNASGVIISPRDVGTLGFLLGTGLAAVVAFLPELLDGADGRGVPQNWFPSLLALWCAASCLMVANARRLQIADKRAGYWLLLAIGAINLALSVDHGANHRLLTARLFTPAEWAQPLATAILASVALLVAGTMAVISNLALRVSLLVWLVLLWVGLPAPIPMRSILPFLAYLTLSVGVVMSLPDSKLCLSLSPQPDDPATQPMR